MIETQEDAGTEGFVASNLRRNFVALALDFGFFGLGMSFASTTTILPALAERLGAPNMVLGALPSIMMLGRALPAVFSARLIQPLPRKLPPVLFFTAWERVPWLILALAVFWLARTDPTLVLALLVVTILAVAIVGGSLSPAWTDIVGRTIPTPYRGRFFALAGAFTTLLGLGGSILSGYFLEAYFYPVGYALCLGATFLCLLASWGSLACAIEPPARASGPRVALGVHLSRLPDMLRSNPAYAWYLVARSLAMLSAMATGFYAVYALRFLDAHEWNVAGFTFALLAAQAVGGLALGSLADRAGHRASLLVGVIANGFAALLALSTPDLLVYHGVFLLTGISTAANNVSSQTIVLEFAPEEERPTYLGLSGTAIAPALLVAPLVAGWMADVLGFAAIFVAAALLSALTATTYLLRVQEPRHRAPTGHN